MKNIYKCKYCNKRYKSWGKWFLRHFSKKHPNEKIACIYKGAE
jgi:hypothetical protein